MASVVKTDKIQTSLPVEEIPLYLIAGDPIHCPVDDTRCRKDGSLHISFTLPPLEKEAPNYIVWPLHNLEQDPNSLLKEIPQAHPKWASICDVCTDAHKITTALDSAYIPALYEISSIQTQEDLVNLDISYNLRYNMYTICDRCHSTLQKQVLSWLKSHQDLLAAHQI